MILNVAAKGIFEYEGKVLIMSDNGLWDLPGGRIENEEHLPEALKRELLEETGFNDFTVGEVVHADEWFIESTDLHVVAVFFRCKSSYFEPDLSDEHSEFAWILPQDLERYNVTPDTTRAFKAVGLL